MKKIALILLLLAMFYGTSTAADTKTTALPENTAPIGTDILYIVDDPGGIAASQKMTITSLFTSPTFVTLITMGSAALNEAELEILDGATLTTTELNYVDGVTSDIQTQINTKITTNGDAGTPSALVGTNITGTAAGLTAGAVSTITGLAPDTATTQATQANITTCANLTTTGALNAGSITSGFGAIDVGASNITTTGTITGGSLATGTSTDPYVSYLVTDVDDTDWYTGVNADAGASSDDNFEFRTSATPGASKHSWLEPDTGDVVYEGATDDAHNLTFNITDPTGSRVVTFDDNNIDFSHTTEDYVLKYNAATRTWAGEADSTGSGSLGTNLTSTTNDITTDNTIIQLVGNSEDLVMTFTANTLTMTSTTALGTVDFGTINLATDGLDLSGGSITNLAVGGLPDGTIDNGTMADNSIDSAEYVDGSIDAVHLLTSTQVVNTITSRSSPTTANPYTLTAANSYNASVYYGATGEIDLPAVADGMAVVIYNTGAFTITIDPNASEVIVRDGTAQTGGVSFTLSSGLGNFVCIVSDGTEWQTLGYKGTLAEGT